MKAILNTDGGSRGNPGPAGCGFSLLSAADDSILAAGGWFIGTATNNVAEYSALLWGLKNAKAAGVEDLEVRADSELMVKQMLGVYKVKSVDLKPLYIEARALAAEFPSFSIGHVYRDKNTEADSFANRAMDSKDAVGNFLVDFDGGPRQESLSFDAHSTDEPEQAPVVPAEEPVQDPKGKPMYSLTIKDHFDAAHKLPGYDGPCQFLHGHTWDVEVTVEGATLDSVGIVYDFKDLKDDLHTILDAYDHKYVNEVPPFDTINPTAENLSRVIYDDLSETLPRGISLKEVAVWESPIAKVTFRREGE